MLPKPIRKQLFFPEMQRAHIHSNLLEQIVSMIHASPEPICFFKVNPIAALLEMNAQTQPPNTALHDGGHDVHFQPPAAPDGNAYTHLCWLAAKDTNEEPSERRGALTPRLCTL